MFTQLSVNSIPSEVVVYFQQFAQILKPKGLDTNDVMDHYEWSISDDENDQALLMDWTPIENLENGGDKVFSN